MANQDAAFGLKPIGFLGSTPMNSGLTEFEVAACASAFSQNDLMKVINTGTVGICLLYTSPSPRDKRQTRMPSSA